MLIVNAGEGVEKKEPSYADGGNENCHIHCGEQYRVFLKKN